MSTIIRGEKIERASYRPPGSDIEERETFLRAEFVRCGRALVKKGARLNSLLKEIFKDEP